MQSFDCIFIYNFIYLKFSDLFWNNPPVKLWNNYYLVFPQQFLYFFPEPHGQNPSVLIVLIVFIVLIVLIKFYFPLTNR